MAIPKVNSVTVSPRAAIYMALHSIRHKNQAVHGLLLGRYDPTKGTTTVTEAVPVAHGAAPSQPILETALGLIHHYCNSSNKSSSSGKNALLVVGWYTAPMLLEDRQPGPVALRIAAQLASSSVESVLLVIQNQELGKVLFHSTSSSATSKCFQALGRDFGDQWLDAVPTTVHPPDNIVGAVQKALQQGTEISDLVDHLEDASATVISWFPNQDVETLVEGL